VLSTWLLVDWWRGAGVLLGSQDMQHTSQAELLHTACAQVVHKRTWHCVTCQQVKAHAVMGMDVSMLVRI